MVFVDVKQHVYLLTSRPYPLPPFSPSLIILMVFVDVKHHVYLLTVQHWPQGATHAKKKSAAEKGAAADNRLHQQANYHQNA